MTQYCTQKMIGIYYTIFHHMIMILVGFILCFNTNIIHLSCALIVVSLDAFSIVILHGCPLTQLEQKYLHTNSSKERYDFLKKCGIVYKCKHEYEKQVELLINVWMLIAVKCLLVITFHTFHITLHNYNTIYA